MNHFITRTYRVRNAALAASSQGTNFKEGDVDVAIHQALSAWSAVAPINFIPVANGQNPDIDINFVDNGQTAELGNALIEINIGNILFTDPYHYMNPHPSWLGPWDFIAEIAHEVGHDLGLHHPPLMPGTDVETAPDALMSRSFSPNVVERYLKQYDLDAIHQIYGGIELNSPVNAHFDYEVYLGGSLQPGMHFLKEPGFVQLDAPVGTSAQVMAQFNAMKHLTLNSIHLRFTTYTSNVIFNIMNVWEDSTLLQRFYVSARNSGFENGQVKEWDLHFGLLSRKKITGTLMIELEILFEKKSPDTPWDYGVIQFQQFSAESLFSVAVVADPVILAI